jgi:hypothetical protein
VGRLATHIKEMVRPPTRSLISSFIATLELCCARDAAAP